MSRSNDGLDPSGTTDAIGGDRGGSSYRSNDGLDPSSTSDAYGGGSSTGGANYRGNDGLDPSGTTDAQSGYSSTRGGNPSYNDRTSGGLGYDDSIGDTQRTGGAERGGDQETSQYTSGGLGQNDTYSDGKQTGGADTGYDHNYGMGTGRTEDQEEGAPLPTEPGRTDNERTHVDYTSTGDGRDPAEPGDYDGKDDSGSGSKKDSTTGKLMEKAGSMFKNENLREKGEEKRRLAGESDGY